MRYVFSRVCLAFQSLALTKYNNGQREFDLRNKTYPQKGNLNGLWNGFGDSHHQFDGLLSFFPFFNLTLPSKYVISQTHSYLYLVLCIFQRRALS